MTNSKCTQTCCSDKFSIRTLSISQMKIVEYLASFNFKALGIVMSSNWHWNIFQIKCENILKYPRAGFEDAVFGCK